MNLRTEPVSKCLEKKLLFLGFEVPDILAIFFLLSILNFLFGRTGAKFFLVWLPVLVLAAILRIGKRGKPDNYLVHLVKFHTRPKYLSGFLSPETPRPPKLRRNHEGRSR
jgi:hypothetical protein